MKVIVLNPPAHGVRFSRDGRCQSEANTWLDTFPPTTLASIAGSVREKYPMRLIDSIGAKISFEDCMNDIQRYQPDYTVINTSTPTIRTDMETARIVKETTGSKIIMYGEHITARYRQLLEKYLQMDYAVIGDPETPIMRILEGNIKSQGVASLDWDGGLWHEPDLDILPFPAYDLLPDYYFPLTGEKWMFVRSGRGCPYGCIYCVIPLLSNQTPRYHSAEYMIKQLKWLIEDLNIHLFMLWDELSTYDRKRMIEMCRLMIQQGLSKKCRWFCTTRVDKFDYEIGKIMKEAGCRMISFGVESGSQKVLNANKKGITLEQSGKAIKAARDNKIKTIGHFVLGLPGSNDKTEKQTSEFARKLKLDFVQFYIATPFPGSELYTLAKEKKWFTDENWDIVEQGTATLSYPHFSAERIQYWKRRAYKEFYLRPQAMRSVLSMMSAKQLIKLPMYFFNFLDWMNK